MSDKLVNKIVSILIDTSSSISFLDEKLKYSLSSISPLQLIELAVLDTDDKRPISLDKTVLPIAIDDDDTFVLHLIVTRNMLFPVVMGINFLFSNYSTIFYQDLHRTGL